MNGMRKELLLGLSIPIIFTSGILAFIFLFPSELQTLGNFISYTSSLSTILMVLVVIVTTSIQTKEMQNGRMLQDQPFPSVTPSDESHIEDLRLFYSPPRKATMLSRRLYFYFAIENIGNGPAVVVDIAPKLVLEDKKGKIVTVEPVWESINSLKQNEKKQIDIMFVRDPNAKEDFIECMMREFLTDPIPCEGRSSTCAINLEIYYKNVLGASFTENSAFSISFDKEDEEAIRSSLKLFETAKIDHAKDMERINLLMKTDEEEAQKLINRINGDLSKKEGATKIQFNVKPIASVFSVKTITEKKYQKAMRTSVRGVQA